MHTLTVNFRPLATEIKVHAEKEVLQKGQMLHYLFSSCVGEGGACSPEKAAALQGILTCSKGRPCSHSEGRGTLSLTEEEASWKVGSTSCMGGLEVLSLEELTAFWGDDGGGAF